MVCLDGRGTLSFAADGPVGELKNQARSALSRPQPL